MKWTVLCLLFAGCVSVKSADGTCSAQTLALMSAGTASCGMLNGIETASTSGLDIQQLAAAVAGYMAGGGMIPIPAKPIPAPTPAPRLLAPDDPSVLHQGNSDFAPRALPPTSLRSL